ncbi:hypothetical protein QEH68_06780 [Paenarthrobacter sp. OM7]|uniref:hypothetical protein n=1 Tax=Paenarthrobacter sp. OM7 TaxID=3041264 RepID=UPI0024696572|nr:hypothetical protein [Paenarthrobacter sp. OM7]WGM21873.1 hypothetical protein QEH68_06780 [Paenarthrobacter sp. OM7]
MTRYKSTALALWLKVQEPRALSAIFFFAYLVISVLGLAVAIDPPRSIQSSIGQGLMVGWGALLLIGGVLGSISVLPGIWWMERAATGFCMTAIGIYGVAVAGLPVTQISTRIGTLCFVIFALLMFATRLVKIRHFAYDPEK